MINSLELFAGAGGLALGLHNAGFNPSAIVEFNKDACRTIRKNKVFSYGNSLHEADVSSFDFLQFGKGVDLISGGPPCQPFSLGGKGQGVSDKRDMFPDAIRAVREIRPKAFVFENVKGLLRKSFVNYFEYILLQLQYPSIVAKDFEAWENHLERLERYHSQSEHKDLEYRVTFRLLNAADYGVPQRRERIFFIGFRNDVDAKWSFPKKTHSYDSLLWSQYISGAYWNRHGISIPDCYKDEVATNKLLKKYGMFKPQLEPHLTVRDALHDLPEPTLLGTPDFDHHTLKLGAKSYPGHTGSYIDEPSKAIKAGAHGVPGGENMIRFENGSVRYFTIRESARIQTFPDNYFFEGSWGGVMRQLGNAVPTKLAQCIGESVKQAIS